MIKLRRLTAGGCAVLVALAASGCSAGDPAETETGSGKPGVVAYEADYPAFDSLDAVVKEADTIVKGTVVGSKVEELMPEVSTGGDPLTNPQAGLSEEEAREVEPVVITVSTVKVSEVLAGDVKAGDTVEVSQLGGTLDGTTYREEHTTTLAEDGTQYLLMLADHGDSSPYDLLNPEQALYTVGTDGTVQPAADGGFGEAGTIAGLKDRAARVR
ncbi:hypothetical protein NPS70_11960 [Streptomyces sp. C10-9-1]|uniref:hypothetical protein n=1 Tax=Streptomyces sp. C10-9-1 TaxID=1859285 RepID=UPI0021134327|nr:hypothetical protein [Streptomyces sp. C10-9-1]MCQ6553905.1 hypothetical protein [Streptomyces sp. C10-9-1]